jgi:hypothetical protein
MCADWSIGCMVALVFNCSSHRGRVILRGVKIKFYLMLLVTIAADRGLQDAHDGGESMNSTSDS